MATNKATIDEIKKAFEDLEEIQKSAKTNAKVEDDEEDENEDENKASGKSFKTSKTKEIEDEEEDDEEEQDEEDEDEDEILGKAVKYLKKAETKDKDEMYDFLEKAGYSKDISKKAVSLFAKKNIKKSMENEFSDDSNVMEEVADATEFLLNFNDTMQKGFQNADDKLAKIAKSMSIFGKGLLSVMETLDKIANTPIQKGIVTTRAIEKEFDKTQQTTRTNSGKNQIKVSEHKDTIMKAMQSLAFNNNNILDSVMSSAFIKFQAGLNDPQVLIPVKEKLEKALNCELELN